MADAQANVRTGVMRQARAEAPARGGWRLGRCPPRVRSPPANEIRPGLLDARLARRSRLSRPGISVAQHRARGAAKRGEVELQSVTGARGGYQSHLLQRLVRKSDRHCPKLSLTWITGRPASRARSRNARILGAARLAACTSPSQSGKSNALTTSIRSRATEEASRSVMRCRGVGEATFPRWDNWLRIGVLRLIALATVPLGYGLAKGRTGVRGAPTRSDPGT